VCGALLTVVFSSIFSSTSFSIDLMLFSSDSDDLIVSFYLRKRAVFWMSAVFLLRKCKRVVVPRIRLMAADIRFRILHVSRLHDVCPILLLDLLLLRLLCLPRRLFAVLLLIFVKEICCLSNGSEKNRTDSLEGGDFGVSISGFSSYSFVFVFELSLCLLFCCYVLLLWLLFRKKNKSKNQTGFAFAIATHGKKFLLLTSTICNSSSVFVLSTMFVS
jgi:hypothetical protein